MNRQAKAPSAFDNGRARTALLALSICAIALLGFAPNASADYLVDRFIGGPSGTEESRFSNPTNPTVNQATGQVYVADQSNQRIQRFDAAGNFELMWGRGVRTGGEGFEICTAAQAPCQKGISGPGVGMFNGPNGTALNQATGDLYVRESTNRRIQQFSFADNGTPADPSDDIPVFVRAFGWDVIPKGAPGNIAVNEKQTITINATGGYFILVATGSSAYSAPIAFDATAAQVQAALEAAVGGTDGIGSIGPGNVSVTGPTGGPWTAEFIGALADQEVRSLTVADNKLTGPGTIKLETTVPGGAFERCTTICQAGPSIVGPIDTLGVGQIFAGGSSRNGIAVSPLDGDVFIIDTAQPTGGEFIGGIKRFNADGTLDAIPQFGSGQFQLNRIGSLAVDSQGILYASDGQANSEIDRYDSSGTHLGGTPGFLAPIAAPPLLPNTAQFTTSGLAVDLGTLPSEDRLFVFRDPSSGNSAIQELVNPGQVVPPATATSHSTTVFGTGQSNGIAYSEALDRLYVSSIAGTAGQGFFGLDADGTTAPSFTLEDPTDLTGLGAKFKATIDANGSINYLFEFSKDGVTWKPVGASKTLVGDGPLAVSQAVALEANTPYRVRLQISKAFAPANVVSQTSSEVLFQTPELGAEAVTMAPSAFTDTSATILGRVKPNGKPTTYRFEWGETSAYGNQIPLVNGDAGLVEKLVQEKLEGLQPDTTYHYRLVAESSAGEGFGDDRTFTTRPAFVGFADRAYEQVTPPEKIEEQNFKESHVLTRHQQAYPITSDGNSFLYDIFEPFPGTDFGTPVGVTLRSEVIAHRLPDRWIMRSSPRPAEVGGYVPILFHALGGPNASKAIVVASRGGWHDNPGPLGDYLFDLDTGATSYLWPIGGMVDPSAVGRVINENVSPIAVSQDMDRMVVFSRHALTDDAGVSADTAIGKVYEWIDGELRLASIDEAGTPFSASTVAGSVASGVSERRYTNAVSADMRHIFLSSPVEEAKGGIAPLSVGLGPIPATKIYRRSDGQTTTLASPSKRSTPDPLGEKAKVFQVASTDGDRAFFTSSEQLTDDANTGPGRTGKDLYRYEVSTDTLIDVSAETNTANGARVQGILGASDEGDWIYYVGFGQPIAGKGTPGQPNVYAWHDDGSAEGQTRFVATLAAGGDCIDIVKITVAGDICNYAPSDLRRTARVSADGQTAVFHSSLALLGNQTNGHLQVYVYEADANGGAGELSCASCRPDGTPSEDFSYLSRTQADGTGANIVGGNEVAQPLSDDGSRIFFTSEDDLLPADTNGLSDVYVWEEGRLELISTGNSADDSYFFGATQSGDDAFFWTREALVGQDFGDAYDIYDAKVGGGLLSQNMPPPGEPCQGEACKSTPLPQPQGQTSPSSNSSGPGNVKQQAKKKKKKQSKKKRGKGKKQRSANKHKAKQHANENRGNR